MSCYHDNCISPKRLVFKIEKKKCAYIVGYLVYILEFYHCRKLVYEFQVNLSPPGPHHMPRKEFACIEIPFMNIVGMWTSGSTVKVRLRERESERESERMSERERERL